MIGWMNAARPFAAGAMMLALGACAIKDGAPPPPAAPAYVAAGVAQTCETGVSMGFAAVIRNKVACQIEASGQVNLKAANLEAEFRRVNTVRIKRSTFVGVADDLLKRWAADPATSLAPRPDFHPTRVEDLAFKATPAIGGEAQAFDIRGRLVAQEGAYALTGRLLMAKGALTLAALDLTPER